MLQLRKSHPLAAREEARGAGEDKGETVTTEKKKLITKVIERQRSTGQKVSKGLCIALVVIAAFMGNEYALKIIATEWNMGPTTTPC